MIKYLENNKSSVHKIFSSQDLLRAFTIIKKKTEQDSSFFKTFEEVPLANGGIGSAIVNDGKGIDLTLVDFSYLFQIAFNICNEHNLDLIYENQKKMDKISELLEQSHSEIKKRPRQQDAEKKLEDIKTFKKTKLNDIRKTKISELEEILQNGGVSQKSGEKIVDHFRNFLRDIYNVFDD
jgi:hypothetical protein